MCSGFTISFRLNREGVMTTWVEHPIRSKCGWVFTEPWSRFRVYSRKVMTHWPDFKVALFYGHRQRSLVAPSVPRWDTLIRTANVRWCTLLWRATQTSSACCWVTTGGQRARAWRGRHRRCSRPSRPQPVWDTHRYQSARPLEENVTPVLKETSEQNNGDTFPVWSLEMRCLQRLNDLKWFSSKSAVKTGHAETCKSALFSVQVVKSLLDFEDEPLAVQMDSHDSLWGETGTFLLSLWWIWTFTTSVL